MVSDGGDSNGFASSKPRTRSPQVASLQVSGHERSEMRRIPPPQRVFTLVFQTRLGFNALNAKQYGMISAYRIIKHMQ